MMPPAASILRVSQTKAVDPQSNSIRIRAPQSEESITRKWSGSTLDSRARGRPG